MAANSSRISQKVDSLKNLLTKELKVKITNKDNKSKNSKAAKQNNTISPDTIYSKELTELKVNQLLASDLDNTRLVITNTALHYLLANFYENVKDKIPKNFDKKLIEKLVNLGKADNTHIAATYKKFHAVKEAKLNEAMKSGAKINDRVNNAYPLPEEKLYMDNLGKEARTLKSPIDTISNSDLLKIREIDKEVFDKYVLFAERKNYNTVQQTLISNLKDLQQKIVVLFSPSAQEYSAQPNNTYSKVKDSAESLTQFAYSEKDKREKNIASLTKNIIEDTVSKLQELGDKQGLRRTTHEKIAKSLKRQLSNAKDLGILKEQSENIAENLAKQLHNEKSVFIKIFNRQTSVSTNKVQNIIKQSLSVTSNKVNKNSSPTR